MIDRVASSIESGVYAMTPDELDRFVVTHTSEISKATPALFIYVPGRERHFGSGVLLQVEDTRFLLTAAHVADDCFHRYKRIFFGTPTFDDLLLSGDTKTDPPGDTKTDPPPGHLLRREDGQRRPRFG